MHKFVRSIRALSSGAAVIGILSGAAACGGEKAEDLQAAQRDVALAPPSTPAVTPPIADVPEKSAPTPPPKTTTTKRPPAKTTTPVTTPVTPPATSTPPATPPAAPAPVYGVIASGSEFAVRPSVKVCTNTQKVGDRITATVSEAVNGTSGVSIPAGATATLEVTKSQFGNNDENKVALDFKVVSVSFDGKTYEVESDVTPVVTKVRRQSTGDQAKKVAIGAAAGAVVGRVIGKDTKSTVVGGAIGAVGGAAAAAGTADYDGCVAADSRMAVKLTQDLRIRV